MIKKVTKIIKPIEIDNQNHRKCPTCHQPLTWLEGLIHNQIYNSLYGRWICRTCKTFYKSEDSRALKKGRKMAKLYDKNNFKWQDISHLSLAEQLGILREL